MAYYHHDNAVPLSQATAQDLIAEFVSKDRNKPSGSHNFGSRSASVCIRKSFGGAWYATCASCGRDVIALPGATRLTDLMGSAVERGCG